MILNADVKKYIDRSILCWLATSNLDGQPNVSPKELFTHYEDKYIIIANVASPNTLKNIKQNPKVSVSFVDVLIQKGYQCKGVAQIITNKDENFSAIAKPLKKMAGENFPFNSLTLIEINSIKPILAPSYLFFPEIKEKDQIRNAKKQYGIN